MRILLACILLLVTPTMAVVIVKQYRTIEDLRQELETASRGGGKSRAGGEVLFFNASWCGPCRQMKPIVSALRGQGYRLRDIDVDKNRAMAAKYKISGIPTFVFLENGTEVKRFSGGTSSQNLKKMCASYH